MSHHNHRRTPSTFRHQLAVVLLFVAVSAFPLICSGSDEATAASDTSAVHSGHNNHHYQNHRRRHHHPRASEHHGVEHSEEVGEVANPPKVLVGYADTYITKKAALELQDHLRHLKQPVTEEEYNELLQKLVTKPKADPAQPTFSKVYYDYVSETKEQQMEQRRLQKEQQRQLASAGVETSEKVIDLTDKVKKARKKGHIKAHTVARENSEQQEEQQEQGEKRARRSVPEDDRQISKRQTGGWTNRRVQERHSRRYESQRTFNVYPQIVPVDQDFDDHNRAATRYQSSYVSPWTNRFYSPSLAVPGPSNYYLPVATPHEYTQFIVRPYQPWMSLPVPGVTYNPAFPPKNPPPGVTGLRPGVSVVRPDTNSIADGEEDEYNGNGGQSNIPSRFGADGLDDDRFIFDIEERTTTTKRPFRTFSQTPPPPSRAPNRRPPPPLIRDSDNAEDTEAAINNIFGNNQFNFNQQQQPRATTRRPAPPLIRNTEDASFGQSTNNFGSTNTEAQRPRPQFTTPTRAPTRPPATTQRPWTPPPTTTATPQNDELSGCVWAIVNCCSPQNRQVRYSCFERFGCGGAFWDINPCNEDVFDSAVDAADKYVE